MRKNDTSNMSIDDILQSIRNVINGKEPSHQRASKDAAVEDNYTEELSLTDVKVDGVIITETPPIPEIPKAPILSDEIANRTTAMFEEFVATASTLGHTISDSQGAHAENKTIENFLTDMLKPQIKEWLDANLPLIVKQIISEEIKRLVAGMNKGG